MEAPIARQLVRRGRLPHRLLQRSVDELSGRRAVLHRLGARRLQGAARRRSKSAFQAEVQGFVGQEATHRRLACRSTTRTSEQRGLVNAVGAARARTARADGRASTCGTALGDHGGERALHGDPRRLDAAQSRACSASAISRLRTLWLWHSAEESEHKSTAFDLYQRAGRQRAVADDAGSAGSRRLFVIDTLRQTFDNLRRDGALLQVAHLDRGRDFLFGKQGLVRHTFAPWREYFRAGFHPEQQDGAASRRLAPTKNRSKTNTRPSAPRRRAGAGRSPSATARATAAERPASKQQERRRG